MNPSPDRGKECLPPKKRESRQGSSEQRPLEDDFKHPAPLRSRRQYVSESRESGGDSRIDKDLLPPPPPPPLPPLPLALPWQVPYQSSIHHPFLSGQPGERHGSGSPSWRDSGNEPPPIPHHSRWLRGNISPLGLQPTISVPTFKSAHAVESRDMWPYFSPSRREYSSSLFPSHHLFPQLSMYPPDLLPDNRFRYPSRRPNGLDGPGIRPESSTRLASGGDCGNESRSRLSVGSHSNGGRKRHHEDPGHSTGRGTLSQEGPNAHSFLQELDRDFGTLGMPKPPTPHTYTSDSRTGKTTAPLEPSSGSASQTGAQIYYSLGSLYQNPPAHTNLSPSGPPPSPLRNSQHSPHSQHNSHVSDQEREHSPGSYRPSFSILSGPDPPPSAVLPHFTKGSLIELAGGRLKRVEELRTEDFLHSADTSPEFHLSTCTILLISPGPTDGFNHLQVLLADRNTQELLTVLEEYPFFVRDRGWSSCSPQRSVQLYGLPCRQLSMGDVCLALTPTPSSANSTSNPAHSRALRVHNRTTTTTKSDTTQVRAQGSERMPPPPAPPPLPSTQIPPSDLQSQEKPPPRKRRWSAPELQAGDGTCLDLPQDCKQVRQQ